MTLRKFSSSDRILDSGCGPGIVSRYLAQCVRQVVGIDMTSEMLRVAADTALKEPHVKAKLEYCEGNMYSLPFADASFDGAVSRYTFHHLSS